MGIPLDELAGLADSLEDAGCTASLEDAGSAAELAGSTEELVVESVALAGAAEELLASAAADSASMTELLIGSWLKGMSTILLELLARDCCWLDVSDACSWLELAGACSWLVASETLSLLVGVALSALLAGAVASLDSGPVVWFELLSDAEVLSSQAFSENTAAMPRTAAMALFLANEAIVLFLIFFFSIFIFSSPKLNFRIRSFKGRNHAEHHSAAGVGADVQLAANVYGSASWLALASVLDFPDGGSTGRTCGLDSFARGSRLDGLA
jgi:hypothetical protein